MTRVCTHLLAAAGHTHTVYIGELSHGVKHICPHFWIEIGDFVLDYRARMWLGGDAAISHGYFSKKTSPLVYRGDAIKMLVSEFEYQILLLNFEEFEKKHQTPDR